MKKFILFIFSLLAMCSCSNEDEKQSIPIPLESKETTAFVKLADDATNIAGVIKIVADVPEAEITWLTTPICNLDTTQTTVAIKNGEGELPVRWLNKQKNGKFAPEATAFKAWIRIRTGDDLTDVPLILSEGLDPDGIRQDIQTRNGDILPRVIALSFNPTEVNLQTATGGSCQLVVEGPGNVTIDYSAIIDAYKIDKTNLPETVTETTILNFRWTGGVAPTTAFNVVIRASDEQLWASCALKYDPNGTGGGDVDLRYVNNTMPAAGNLPATSNIYTFNFEGTYTGKVQLRTLSNGTLLYTATEYDYPANQPRARVPENVGVSRPISFEYRAGTGQWIAIPAADRVQNGQGTTPPGGGLVYTPITPPGDIPDRGGVYSTTFYNYTGTVEFHAVSGNGRELASMSVELTAGSVVPASLTIPEAGSFADTQVIFQYRIAGGQWQTMETRKQVVETFGTGSIVDLPNTIPAGGGTYHYESSGSLTALLTIYAKDGDNVLAQSRGAAGSKISITVPANTTGKPRAVFFWYERGDQPGKMGFIQRGDQAGR